MIGYLTENALSLLSLVISLYIFFGNQRIFWKNYVLNRSSARSEAVELIFVESRQIKENVILKLVLFNPGNIAAIINSLTIYRLVPHTIQLLRYFGFKKWEKIEGSRWWPSCDEESENIKTLQNEYASLYVKEYRNIFVNLPGYISRGNYKFFVQTNHGSIERISNIDATEIYFSHDHKRWYLDS